MNVQKFIEIGKEKVRNGYCSNQFNDLNEKVFEILGLTEADYFGTDEIQDIKKKFDKENDIYDMKFYSYISYELVECSFGKAVSTPEYEKDNIFIFSQMEDEARKYYVAIIINND
ncbi:hypothetical protein [[Clostridium] symbiosum]|uniref:hypothetical protein n=1 Tax=Clostridium symbiosum TaxID=1512 RepID=UPI00189D16FF|nr:hypothetical protein [[Clostridium] symbiosum]